MNSIRAEITAQTIANQVRLERAVHKGSFLLLEGDNDCRLFKKFIDSLECSLVNCHFKEVVLGSLRILEAGGFVGALGIVDKDYWDFIQPRDLPTNLVQTDENDIEIMILRTEALLNVLREFGSERKMRLMEAGACARVEHDILESAARVGALRLLSARESLNLKFRCMTYKFESNSSMVLDLRKTVEHVLARSQRFTTDLRDELIQKIERMLESPEDVAAFCNGHDCVRILGRALRHKLGSNGQFDSDDGASNLGKVLRLAYERTFFIATNLFSAIRSWESATGYVVLNRQNMAQA